MNELTEREKAILKMLIEIGAKILKSVDDIVIDGEDISKDDVYSLAEKCGIDTVYLFL